MEIGVSGGGNFAQIRCPLRIGVDPIPPSRKLVVPELRKAGVQYHKMTSDQFFNSYPVRVKVDVCFIDGLHTAEQALRDFNNVRQHLSDKGIVVFHDCLPENEKMQEVPRVVTQWTGDVWKAFYSIRQDFRLNILPQLRVPFVVNTDYGCGIVQDAVKLEHDVLLISPLSWPFFNRDRMGAMSPESFETFINTINN